MKFMKKENRYKSKQMKETEQTTLFTYYKTKTREKKTKKKECETTKDRRKDESDDRNQHFVSHLS